MSSDPEDDALSWEGDDALEARRPSAHPAKSESVDTPPPARKDAAGEPRATPMAGGAEQPGGAEKADVAEEEEQGIGTVSLLMFGILGGIYLLYTIGWFIGGAGMQSKAMFMLPAPLYVASLWMAILAPALWFAASFVLTRGAKTWVRFAALIVGVVLLVPWPFVVAGGGGVL